MEFNGHLGYPHSGSTGTTGRAARERRVPRPSSPAVAHGPPMPSPPRKCLVASTRGRAHQTANLHPERGSLFLEQTYTTLAVRRTPCLTSHQANCRLCHPSFNGRRPPDAPLFQPQLIAALPSFQQIVPCVFVGWLPSVTCQKYGGLVSPCAPAHRGRAACLVYLHGREGVSVYHPPSHLDRLRQLGPVGCEFDPYVCPSCLTPPALPSHQPVAH